MRRAILNLLAVGFVMTGAIPFSSSGWAEDKFDLKKLAADAVSENAGISQPAIAALRDAGPAGLAALEDAHQATIEQHAVDREGSADPAWQRLKAALDAVGAQRDCYASQLYWYTDFDAAKAAAKQSGKPILSLRLLGKLTDEFSCANSRFFRSTLYSNAEISRVLRDRFVLHWQSVRPVPKVTIDFGDGRKLERTLTGNSIHYVLDSEGHVIDALPGLYGPQAFLRGLEQAEAVVAEVKSLDEQARIGFLQEYHQQQANAVLASWQNDLEQLGLLTVADYSAAETKSTASQRTAVEANRISYAKAQAETPILASALADAKLLTAKTGDEVWGRIAQLHRADAKLDAASVALIRSQNPTAGSAAPLTASKAMVENPLLRLVSTFQNTIAIDTVRNEYTLHRQIHEWFASGGLPVGFDVNSLNERVYAQLFLTPSSDPWLGLLPGDAYTALDNDGVTQQ